VAAAAVATVAETATSFGCTRSGERWSAPRRDDMYRSSLRGREGDGNGEAMAVARSDLAWSDELASSVRLFDRSIDLLMNFQLLIELYL
jgi:hypothetical protein